MAAPADSSSTTAVTTAGEDEALLVKTTKPLPRAIQLVMAISSGSKSPTTTTASTKTIREPGGDRGRFFLWFLLVVLPSIVIAAAAASTYTLLRDSGVVEELISSPGGYSFVAVPNLVYVYMAVLLAAGGHLGLFAPRTPYAAWDAFLGKGYEIGLLAGSISSGVCLFKVMVNQVWPLLVAWTYLLGLLVASTVSFWLCLLRTYGDGGGGERRRENSSCGEAVIDGLAYIFGRLLYETAVRLHAGVSAQQLDAADVAV